MLVFVRRGTFMKTDQFMLDSVYDQLKCYEEMRGKQKFPVHKSLVGESR